MIRSCLPILDRIILSPPEVALYWSRAPPNHVQCRLREIWYVESSTDIYLMTRDHGQLTSMGVVVRYIKVQTLSNCTSLQAACTHSLRGTTGEQTYAFRQVNLTAVSICLTG